MNIEATNRFVQQITNAHISRRRLFAAAGITMGGAAIASMPVLAAAQPDATPVMVMESSDATSAAPVDVLNYTLTLEHLEAAFYRDGLAAIGKAGITGLGFQPGVFALLETIADHEAIHVATLSQVVMDLGGEPVAEAVYDFGYPDAAGFLQVAEALEDTGVAAYTGAAQYLIDEDALLTAALTIHGVEARHAAYLALVNGTSPFPEAFNPVLTPDEVPAIAGPFIVRADAQIEATPVASTGETSAAVEIVDFAFNPAELEVAAGTTVTWTNVGKQPHTATAEDDSFDTGVLTNGKSASHTFTEAGTFPYVCTLHESTMQGVLIVS